MKSKTIKSILRNKIKSWSSSVDNQEIKEIIENETIVTGGAIVSMLLNEKISDFDVYFRTKQSVLKVAKYYVERFKKNPPTRFKSNGESVPISVEEETDRVRIKIRSVGIATESGSEDYQYFENANPDDAEDFVDQAAKAAEDAKSDEAKEPYRPVFLTSNAITLSDDVQVVVRFYGEPDEIHENYDFVHCMNYWQSWDGRLELKPESLECILNKELRYSGSRYPICSLFRMRKFIERGWRINAGQILKAAMQISDLDLTIPRVLEDQLVGVDAAYFEEIIRLCNKRMEETKEDRVDRTYLVELIDRIF